MGGRVKRSRTHIDVLLAANAKQVQQSMLNMRLRREFELFEHTKEGMGMGLPCRVDVASCASVGGTEGETVVDCRRCGLEFVDG